MQKEYIKVTEYEEDPYYEFIEDMQERNVSFGYNAATNMESLAGLIMDSEIAFVEKNSGEVYFKIHEIQPSDIETVAQLKPDECWVVEETEDMMPEELKQEIGRRNIIRLWWD